jgi:hypothetical protein
MKTTFLKKLAILFKEAGPMQDWAREEETEPEHKDAADPMQEATDKLATAIAAYGDGAGLAADHPLHALKALHKEMSDGIAMRQTNKTAEVEAARKAAEADDVDAGGRVTKAEIQIEVNKAIVDMNKKLEATEARAVAAETLAKSERDLRELDGEKMTLRKFKHVTLDVEKDAPVFAKLRVTDKPLYDLMIAKLNAAEAIVQKAAVIEQDLGSPLGGAGQTAWAEIEAEADKIVAKGATGITREKAIDQVMKARPELVKKYKAEESGQVS